VAVEAVLDGSYARQELAIVSAAVARAEAAAAEPKITVAVHAGLLWNLRQTPGLAVSLEALRRLPGKSPPWLSVGLSAGYLRSEAVASDGLGLSRLTLDQVPLLVVARARGTIQRRLEASLALGAGVDVARARLVSAGATVAGRALAPAFQGAAELGLRVRRGLIALRARYLQAHLGALSSGDVIDGNSGGLVIEAGYRVGF
jgi:hypothetical protein